MLYYFDENFLAQLLKSNLSDGKTFRRKILQSILNFIRGCSKLKHRQFIYVFMYIIKENIIMQLISIKEYRLQ